MSAIPVSLYVESRGYHSGVSMNFREGSIAFYLIQSGREQSRLIGPRRTVPNFSLAADW